MQLDDPYFGVRQPPRTFTDATVNGQPLSLWAMVPSGIVLAVLLYALYQEMNVVMLVLLVFIGTNCYAMLTSVIRPPQMTIRNGQFSLRFGKTKLLRLAADVADLHMEEQAVHIRLYDIFRSEPGTAGEQVLTLNRHNGCHIVVPTGIYTLDQVNQLRTALGMPEQPADAAGQRLDEFQSSVMSHRPLVTASLIVACVIVYLAQAFQDKSLMGADVETSIAWGADYGPRTLGGEWWRLVTHFFLHGNPFHILMNMWVLWDVGRLMERLVGRTAMIMIYFLAGIAGGMASLAFHPNVVSVGASGAVFGIIGGLFGVLMHAHDVVPPARLQQLRSAIIAFVIFNLMFGLSVQGIDNAAHIGGAVAGLLAGLIVLPAKAAGHWLRIGLLAIVGTGAILLAARFLPPPPRDFVVLRKQFPERQRQILETYHDLMRKHPQGDLLDTDFADQLETEVVVPWRELTADMSAVMRERVDAERWRKMDKYMRLQQESFEDLLASIRNQDPTLEERSLEKQSEAFKIATEMNGEKE